MGHIAMNDIFCDLEEPSVTEKHTSSEFTSLAIMAERIKTANKPDIDISGVWIGIGEGVRETPIATPEVDACMPCVMVVDLSKLTMVLAISDMERIDITVMLDHIVSAP